MRNSFLIFLLCSLLGGSMLMGQRGYSFTAGIGGSYYYGDLTDYFHNLNVNTGVYLGYGYYFTPGLSLRIGLMRTTLSAADSLAFTPDNQRRDLHFRSPLTELSGMLFYELNPDKHFGLGWRNKSHFTPYIFGGVAVVGFRPRSYSQGEWVDLQPLGTEGQYLSGGTYPEPYSLLQLAFPGGFGASHRFSNNVSINMDFGYRLTLTDYLDDVSTVYPDFGQLTEVQGSLATQLSDPSGRFQPGQQRGNPNVKDSYFFVMISLSYYLDRNGEP
jgi:opacity protein-like surface antigen